jgi:hypothetical protein
MGQQHVRRVQRAAGPLFLDLCKELVLSGLTGLLGLKLSLGVLKAFAVEGALKASAVPQDREDRQADHAGSRASQKARKRRTAFHPLRAAAPKSDTSGDDGPGIEEPLQVFRQRAGAGVPLTGLIGQALQANRFEVL